jgi:hypothetical protein
MNIKIYRPTNCSTPEDGTDRLSHNIGIYHTACLKATFFLCEEKKWLKKQLIYRQTTTGTYREVLVSK